MFSNNQGKQTRFPFEETDSDFHRTNIYFAHDKINFAMMFVLSINEVQKQSAETAGLLMEIPLESGFKHRVCRKESKQKKVLSSSVHHQLLSLRTPPPAGDITGGAEGVVESVDSNLHHLPQRLVL